MKETDFIALDQKIEYLVALCQKLQDDNRHLRHQKQAWAVERVKLMEKNDVARHKIEAMINRIRSLEHQT